MRFFLVGAALLGLSTPPLAAQEPAAAPGQLRLSIDVTHSELVFRIRQWSSRVSGTFQKWSGAVVLDTSTFTNSSVEVSIETASIFTQNERRDNHLRSGDFFDAAAHPTITFRSTKIEGTNADFALTGDLTMHGVTRPIVLKGKMIALMQTPMGPRAGFEATTRITRADFGVTYNTMMEGMTRLGDDVDITIAIQAVMPRPRPAGAP